MRSIAALDATTGTPTAWNPSASRPGVTCPPWPPPAKCVSVKALAVSGSTVYAGGNFTAIGGQTRNRIAALDASTGAATAWDPNANESVRALVVRGGAIYAGGEFTNIGGQARNKLAAIDPAVGAAMDWNPNANHDVYALAVSDPEVYAGGKFTGMGGLPQSHIAAIRADGPTATVLVEFVATTTAEGIELRWGFGDGQQISRVDVERSPSPGGPWWSIAPELHDASGVTVALDREVALDRAEEAAREYFYRLVVQFADGSSTVFGPVSARSSRLSRSDVTSLAPNPTSAGARVQFAVARAGRVRLELLDVSGRVAATLVDRTHAPGSYAAVWDGVGRRGQPVAGLYFLRLTAPDHMATRRLAIVR